MTCKIHLATDCKGRPLGLVLTAGQAADTSFFQTMLETFSVAGSSRGRPRMRPDRVLADKAYTSSANRAYLAGRGIKATVPERSDQIAGRARRGSKGGRPRSFDKETYKGRNVVERCFNRLKQWRGIATRTDKTERSYLAGVTLASTPDLDQIRGRATHPGAAFRPGYRRRDRVRPPRPRSCSQCPA